MLLELMNQITNSFLISFQSPFDDQHRKWKKMSEIISECKEEEKKGQFMTLETEKKSVKYKNAQKVKK